MIRTNDDGGLTILLPFILTKNKRWNNCKLRVFTVVDHGVNYSQEKYVFIQLIDEKDAKKIITFFSVLKNYLNNLEFLFRTFLF